MIFPFSKTYKERLNGRIGLEDQYAILDYIKTLIEKEKANNIVVDNNTVSYKGSTSFSQTSLFGGLKGTFSLIDIDEVSYLVYELRMAQLFIVTSITAVFFGVISQSWLFGFIGFLWLCGMNWIIYLIRHSELASEIAIYINYRYFIKQIDNDQKADYCN